MKTLSAKIFFRDLIFLLTIFVPLLMSLPGYYLNAKQIGIAMGFGVPRGNEDGNLNIYYGNLPFRFVTWGIFGNIYCVLFYLFTVKKILLRTSAKKTSLSFFTLTICYFTIDIALTSLYRFLKNELDKITLLGPGINLVGLVFIYAMLYSTIKGLVWFRRQKIESEKKLIESSLSQLRAKINPNFVFNSLRSVYSLSQQENAPKTSQSIEELSALFRYSLKQSTMEKVPLKNELEFIEKYIHLHRIRLDESEKIKVTTSILWDKKSAEIIPMLLINFIENAFKYGISATRPSFIDVLISVENKKLNLIVRNSVHGNNNADTSGMGLKNSHERLNLLYHDRYTLKQKKDETMHETILNINLA